MILFPESEAIEKAYQIAKAAHKGQVDKGGNDYIKHPIAVASLVKTEDEKIVALLHDVVEDTLVSLQNLREKGFAESIIEAVDCITKRNGETLESYLNRVKSNRISTVVKIADLTHNSDITRIPNPKQKDYDRLERYKQELAFLSN